MKRKRVTHSIVSLVCGVVFSLTVSNRQMIGVNTALAQTGQADKPVEQTRKNIQVLKGLPESQLFLVMNFVGDALGVHCDYCHVKNGKNPTTGVDNWVWESDEKPQKIVGREMIKLVLDLNKTRFGGKQTITCYSCHRGSLSVARVVPLPPRDFTVTSENHAALPTAEQIFNKYTAAVGGKDSGAKFKTMIFKGTYERSQGRSEPFEVTLKAPDKYLLTLIQPQGVIRQGLNGTVGWVNSNNASRTLSAGELPQLKRAAALYDVVKITEPSQMTVLGTEKVGDRTAYEVAVRIDANTIKRLFFDAQTGLLLREISTTETLFAPLPEQVNYEDYKDVDGVKLPFTIRTSGVAAFNTTTRKISEIRRNVTVDDAIFNQSIVQK